MIFLSFLSKSRMLMRVALLIFALSFLFLLNEAGAAWQEPSGQPPTQNVSAPINVSSQGQAKAGGLTVGSANLGSFTLFSAGTLGVQGAATLQSTLSVQQAATFQNTVTVNGAADFDSSVNVDGQLDARGGLRAYDGAATRFWVDNASDKVLINTTVTTPNGVVVINGGSVNGAYISSTSRNALEVTSANALFATLDATHTQASSLTGRGVAVLGKGANASASGNLYSYGVYGQAGDVGGLLAGNRTTYGVYGEAGDALTGDPRYIVTYGIYGRAGLSGRALSYAGYFEGEVQVCGRGEGCSSFGTRDHSAAFSQDSVYFSQESPISGGKTIVSTVPGRENEKRVVRVDNGLYLGYSGWSSGPQNEHPGTLLMHDRQRPDHVYRIEVIDSFLVATRVSSCLEGLYCSNERTVVREQWNGDNGPGAGCVDPPTTVQVCAAASDTPRCLNGKCVTRCEYEGFFCGRRDSTSCGTTTNDSCGTNNGLVCCTGT